MKQLSVEDTKELYYEILKSVNNKPKKDRNYTDLKGTIIPYVHICIKYQTQRNHKDNYNNYIKISLWSEGEGHKERYKYIDSCNCLDMKKYKVKFGDSKSGHFEIFKKIYTLDEALNVIKEFRSISNKNVNLNKKTRVKNTIDKDDSNYIAKIEETTYKYEYKKEKNPKPKKRRTPLKEKESNGKNKYPRDSKIGYNALFAAEFKCEINKNHKTFRRRKDGTDYTEPHHLVPMSAQDDFEYSLDREQNIVSLCSNCHNEIHYGENGNKLVEKLFNERKGHLKEIGIEITLDKLLKYYGF